MISIRREIRDVENARFNVGDSPLRHAPHTVHDLADDEWKRSYSRSEGCFPPGTSRTDKYWAPVGRVDNAYGDRNLICSCAPVETYAKAAG
jgi:glycine dehydrogenase